MIRFSFHPLFFLVIIFTYFYGSIYETVLLFTVVLIHELGHAFTAKAFGWRVRKIQLLPIGGVAEVEEHGTVPTKEEVLVTIAGPLMNVMMIVAGFLFLHLDLWNEAFCSFFINVNIIVLLFNLLPIWPLDGGKLLLAFLCCLLPYRRAMMFNLWLSAGGVFIYVILVFYFYPQSVFLWMVFAFLLFSIYMEFKQLPYVFMRFLMNRYHKDEGKLLEVMSVCITSKETLKQALEKMFKHRSHYFCLIHSDGYIDHLFYEQELLYHYFENRSGHCTVRDLLG